MHRMPRIMAWLAARGLLVAVLGLVAAGYLQHIQVSPVLTGSMVPTFAPGDAVVTRQVPLRDLHVGQVAVLVPPGQTSSYAHRVVSISGDPAHPVVRTRGDANSAPDPWAVPVSGRTVTEVLVSAPRVGNLLVAGNGSAPRALLILAVGLAATFLVVRRILTSGDTTASAFC